MLSLVHVVMVTIFDIADDISGTHTLPHPIY